VPSHNGRNIGKEVSVKQGVGLLVALGILLGVAVAWGEVRPTTPPKGAEAPSELTATVTRLEMKVDQLLANQAVLLERFDSVQQDLQAIKMRTYRAQ